MVPLTTMLLHCLLVQIARSPTVETSFWTESKATMRTIDRNSEFVDDPTLPSHYNDNANGGWAIYTGTNPTIIIDPNESTGGVTMHGSWDNGEVWLAQYFMCKSFDANVGISFTYFGWRTNNNNDKVWVYFDRTEIGSWYKNHNHASWTTMNVVVDLSSYSVNADDPFIVHFCVDTSFEDYVGIGNIKITCTDVPTSNPTTDPTPKPTKYPTKYPTTQQNIQRNTQQNTQQNIQPIIPH
eukprot:432824_1